MTDRQKDTPRKATPQFCLTGVERLAVQAALYARIVERKYRRAPHQGCAVAYVEDFLAYGYRPDELADWHTIVRAGEAELMRRGRTDARQPNRRLVPLFGSD